MLICIYPVIQSNAKDLCPNDSVPDVHPLTVLAKSMKPVSFLLLALMLVAGCDSSNSTQQPEPEVEVADQKGTITRGLNHDGRDRTYILYVPDSYTGDDPAPVVFNFHGYTSNATEQMGYGDFRPIADTAGFIVVHPQGTLLDGSTHWNVGGWTLASTVDDVGLYVRFTRPTD